MDSVIREDFQGSDTINITDCHYTSMASTFTLSDIATTLIEYINFVLTVAARSTFAPLLSRSSTTSVCLS